MKKLFIKFKSEGEVNGENFPDEEIKKIRNDILCNMPWICIKDPKKEMYIKASDILYIQFINQE
jgi:hypothetical protein